MSKTLKIDLLITIVLIILGQIIFLILSPRFLQVSYSNQIFTTIGVTESQDNLQSLSEAANQFGQTITGWLKFPHFMEDLSQTVPLPEGSSMSSYLQERQNLIITLNTPTAIELDTLSAVKDYLQNKINTYNKVSQTSFVLTQIDFNQSPLQKSYKFGASVTLIITLILSLGVWFLRRETRS